MFDQLGTFEHLVLLVLALVAGGALLMALLGSTAMGPEDDSGTPFMGCGGLLLLLALVLALVVVL